MNTSSVLNEAPRHEDVWVTEYTALRILKLGTLRPIYHRRKGPGTHWTGSWLGPSNGLDAVAM